MQFAHELDAAERVLMAEGGVNSADFLTYAAEESGNVAASGMFSIQVLARALEVWGLSAVPLTSPAAAAARADPQSQAAFVCNLQEHWFTVRRVAGEWWNLNSLFAAPEPLSPFYLAAFLASLQGQGYSIFHIQGALPAPLLSSAADAGGPGVWFTTAQARAEAQQSQQLKKAGFLQAAARGALGMASAAGTRMALRAGGGAGVKRGHSDGGAEDADLARALAASRAESRGGNGGGGGSAGRASQPQGLEEDEEADLAAAIAASLQEPAAAGSPPTEQPGPTDERPPAAAAAAGPALPVLGEEPGAGEGVREVGVRLPSGQRHSRRFGAGATVGHVAAFAAALGVDMPSHRLATSFPRTVLSRWEQPLGEAGVEHKQVLSVEPAA